MILPPPVYRDFVLPALRDWRKAGRKTALLTLISTTGQSPRPVGSQLAVCDTGEACGLITGGCAEGTLVLDALEAMRLGENRVELYGEGSRFKDITLPCGSGLKVFFDVGISDAEIERIIASRDARQPASMSIFAPGEPAYTRHYLPACRLVAVGQGPIMEALAQMALPLEIELDIWSPDVALAARLNGRHLTSPEDFDAALDRYSAVTTVFHDHTYEPPVLLKTLQSESFFIGALGSRKAHARRLEILTELGAAPETVTRIHGPVGLDIAAASPPEIALSILAQVVERWRRTVAA
ncbi:XdhC family protein [Asticcacaulis taihuensis]|uniref:Xanthine dehydrogenase accessory factor n=1 Tax=Asticcacaulis taihuensis TaxID=260084 RepID=A0A1G4RKP1_9CAUL|nr:XdhC family protein [Asticcacaulis taihuensis]SCW56749.1 xanthine dehydrogenase accessory factor [Asticcacaulis taihuensis]